MRPFTQQPLETSYHDQWIEYLNRKGITADPFRRAQWETNSSKLLQALGFNEIGANMKFDISDDIRTQITSRVRQYDKSRTGKDQFRISVVSSLPGGGKTRLLLELLSLLSDFNALYYISFHNFSKFDEEYDTVYDVGSFKKSIAMRMLFQAVQIQEESSQRKQHFSTWLKEVRYEKLLHINSIPEAIKLLGGDPSQKCVLAVDEASKLQYKETAIARLIEVLGDAMLGTKVFSFMAGTLLTTFAQAAATSTYNINPIQLRPLSFDQQSTILDANKSLGNIAWRCNGKAKWILSLLGGHPRLLEVFIDKLSQSLGGHDDLSEVIWTDVESECKRCFLAVGTILNVSLAKRLIDVILLREKVQANSPLLPNSRETYEYLQQNSAIVLEPISSDPRYFNPTIPFLHFRDFVHLANSGDEDIYRHLYSLVHMASDSFASFEKFVATHTAVMNGLFAQRHTNVVRLSQLYAGGYGGAGKIAIKFMTKNPRTITCSQQFPSTSSSIKDQEGKGQDFADGNIYINAPSASFGDVFWVGQMDGENTETDEKRRTKMGNADQRLLFYLQVKLYQQSLNADQCYKEHERNKEAWKKARGVKDKKDYRLITIILSTGPVNNFPKSKPGRKDTGAKFWDDILVIDKDVLPDLFGVLLPLLNPRLTKRYDINCGDWASMKTKFGENGATQIIAERGFKDRSDFERRLPKVEGKTARSLAKILNGCDF